VDVPVGTGVFTAPVYARLPNATIIAVDSSMGMLRKAADRFRRHGLKNVRLLHADVANLPIADSVADQFKGFTVTHRGNSKSVVYLEASYNRKLWMDG